MLSESHPLIRTILRFLALPYCYIKLVNWEECSTSKYQVLKDLFYIFSKLKYFPDNYSPCRFWEKKRSLWSYYYGSSYNPLQRAKLRKEVQRFEYINIFNDKEVCELLARGMGVTLPLYYGIVSPEGYYKDLIKEILRTNGGKSIIIKPVKGSAGRGIVVAYAKQDKVYIKTGNVERNIDEFKLLERAIIQEVIQQDDTIANISSSSVNTIRTVTLYTNSNDAIVISATMRFGVGAAYVDNWSAGGVAVGVDCKAGKLMEVAYDKKGRQYLMHPGSKFLFNGFQIPRWSEVVSMSVEVQKKCPFFKLLGLDIAITNNGPVLIEINPDPDLIFQEQTAGPLLRDDKVLEEFYKYDLLINKFQKALITKAS